MSSARLLVTGNLLLAAGFLVYLCLLDYIFVVHFQEQLTVINYLSVLIVLLPVIGGIMTYRRLSSSMGGNRRLLLALAVAGVMSCVALVEYLWVATHFHTMLGGTV